MLTTLHVIIITLVNYNILIMNLIQIWQDYKVGIGFQLYVFER